MTSVWMVGVVYVAAAIGMGVLAVTPLAKRNAGVVDLAWAIGTGAAAIILVVAPAQTLSERHWLLILLAGAWALRLALHLGSRLRREPEDGRYTYMKSALGDDKRIRPSAGMFLFFQIQATWVVLFALPAWAAATADRAFDLWDVVGAVVFVASLLGVSTADRQLAAFRSDPNNQGQVCEVGLWARSRHPNYFFEWLGWISYVFIGLGSSLWWVTIGGAVLMYVFLSRVTGVPFAEAQSLRSKGDAYRHYQQRVPPFFPRLFGHARPESARS